MSGDRLLASRLERLASAGLGEGAGRTIRAEASRGLVEAILGDADTVVMPRELRAVAGSGKGLALEIANRRILAARGLDPGAEAVTLEGAAKGADSALRTLFDAVLDGEGSVRIRHRPLGREVAAAEPGVSVRSLAEAWGIALDPPIRDVEGDVLDRFLAESSGSLAAWVMVSGEISESVGDEALADRLLALAKDPVAASLREAARAGAWRFVALGRPGADAGHLAAAALGETLFLMALRPGALQDVADHWRRTLA